MALTDDNSMVMPVTPMYGGGGGNGGFGNMGNDWGWIILLLLLAEAMLEDVEAIREQEESQDVNREESPDVILMRDIRHEEIWWKNSEK